LLREGQGREGREGRGRIIPLKPIPGPASADAW